ncbi:FKBP-type peptidyl-prolyl cis-trans isomerase [Nocardioides sp. KIGAM211]|uniref:Peptidyl-prolyl cis-trans isomerase n=1 Tax=Nocardioides luti TaxID=2761101 RepID=A0A7X0REZ6_9ACTN|nr:FKBP-type peptidyl-prolyl cis-trans isomerase [Nocardioides luti]
MSRRLRRLPFLLLPLVFCAATLTACGDSGDDSAAAGSAEGLKAVSITGDVGSEPKVTWKSEMSSKDIVSTALTTGDGDALKDGDKVEANIWIGNGFTKEKSFSSYDQGQPETITLNDQLSPVFADAMKDATIGSRIAVTAPADKAFGETGNPQLNIGNKDSVLVIIDIMSLYEEPKPKDVPESKLPGIIEKKGEPTGLDFKGLPEPKADGDLLRAVVKQGTGKTVTADMTVTANYLGQVYGAKKPFDESYSKKPVPFSLAQVVQGWTAGLTGVKVGSRVLLQIPPGLGYGAQEQANIPANSTLYFVVDIISAK